MSGVITNTTLYSDMKTLIPLIISSYVYQVSGADHFSVSFQDRDTCPPDSRPCIYWNNLQITPFGTLDSTVYKCRISFSMGTKYSPKNAGHLGFVDQISTVADMWNPYNCVDRRYSFTFKTKTYTNANLGEMGIFNPFPGGNINYYDNECGCYTTEFPVTFDIHFKNTFDFSHAYLS